ncbi:5-deoxy-glucuronate isomerase [invertebrate metagenome]|uniref:5-deoxy-glucuronate isomerase n=1 Tax=invertebrate metagenome TaxID=1711999 RepID=A0A2H9T6Z8_9ZZZZ
MGKHIAPFDNRNEAIIPENDNTTPLCYFNNVKLVKGGTHRYHLSDYETSVVLASGTCHITVDDQRFTEVGERASIWEGNPSAVYAPVDSEVHIECVSETAEILIAGGRYEKKLTPFVIRPDDIDIVQYGSDETKTHRKIKHILGQANADKRGRLLISELFTVGKGGWSGFPPHKHDEDREGIETRFEEVYQFRFDPPQGFGTQFLYTEENQCGPCYMVKDGSVIAIDKGYHPSVTAPGYRMYYFTIIVGETSQSLLQYFEPAHADQVNTIPGIKDMVAKFK